MASETKPAPKEHPIRQVTEAFDFLLNEVFADKLMPWLLLPLLLVPYAVLEWLRFLLDSDPAPMTATVIAVAGIAAAAVMIRRALIEARETREADEGLRVGDALGQLAAKGYHVFRDIECGDFKIDYVAVGATGIYTIETKAWSKPIGKRARIVVDRNGLAVAGQPPNQNVLANASAKAASLADLLKESAGKSLRVRPVLLFPGWSIDQKCPRMAADPWVLDTKAFLKMVERAQALLNEEQIALASFHLWQKMEGAR